MFLGQPVVTQHKGTDTAKNWREVLNARKISGDQLVGASVDGQYFHLSVE